jgi:hypothetical protein
MRGLAAGSEVLKSVQENQVITFLIGLILVGIVITCFPILAVIVVLAVVAFFTLSTCNDTRERARFAQESAAQAQIDAAQAQIDAAAAEAARQAQEKAALLAQEKLTALAKSPRLNDRMQTWIGHNIQDVISAFIEQPALEANRHVGGCSNWNSGDATVCAGGLYSYSAFGNSNGKLYIFRTTAGPASFVTDYAGTIESAHAKNPTPQKIVATPKKTESVAEAQANLAATRAALWEAEPAKPGSYDEYVKQLAQKARALHPGCTNANAFRCTE